MRKLTVAIIVASALGTILVTTVGSWVAGKINA
jgi:hypothetical protein